MSSSENASAADGLTRDFVADLYCSSIPKAFSIANEIHPCHECDQYRDRDTTKRVHQKPHGMHGRNFRCNARNLGGKGADNNPLPAIKLFVAYSETPDENQPPKKLRKSPRILQSTPAASNASAASDAIPLETVIPVPRSPRRSERKRMFRQPDIPLPNHPIPHLIPLHTTAIQ